MWDDVEVRPSGEKKVLFAAGAVLLLLLLAGVFFLLPMGFAGMPTLVASRRQPSLITSKKYVNPGFLVTLEGDDAGFWRAWSRDGIISITRFDLDGEQDWVGEFGFAEPVMHTNGDYAVLADKLSGEVYLLKTGKGMVERTMIEGKPQLVAVARTGDWLALYEPNVDASVLNPSVVLYNPQGTQLFTASFENALPLMVSFNRQGTQFFLLLGKVTDDGVENHLLSYDKSGQLLWTAQLPSGPPVDLIIKPMGDRVAVAVGNIIHLYSGLGQLLWQHVAQGNLHSLSFTGQADQLAYSSEKMSVLSFKRHGTLALIDQSGVPVWQCRTGSDAIDLRGGSALSVVAAGKQVTHLVGIDGKARWSYKHDFSKARIAVSEDGSTLLAQFEDGSMFVLRGE